MSKTEIGQKATRVLKFLVGVRHPKVAQALMAFGFDDDALQDGWKRLSAVTRVRLVETPSGTPDPRLLKLLDEFENLWFPVAKVTLMARYPEAHDALFTKLSQAKGTDVAVTVQTFLERLGQMEKGEGGFAQNGPAARALLSDRGLTQDVVSSIEAVISRLQLVSTIGEQPTTKDDRLQAEADLWNWYLEWSGIARVVVKDRRYLRAMGFLTTRKTTGTTEDAELEETIIETPSTPEVTTTNGEEAPLAAE